VYENFLNDIKDIPGYDDFINNPGEYEFDKDVLQSDVDPCNKIYSKDTCCFISRLDNLNTNIIQNNIRNKDNLTSQYYGVSVLKRTGKFNAETNINGKSYYLGTFSSEIAAANAYNQAIEFYCGKNNNRLYNDVEYMHPSEVMKYRSTHKVMAETVFKEMCVIINN
jgi:hypothetical protein